MTGPFILLHPNDNVLVARKLAPEGTNVELASGMITLTHVHVHNIRSAYTPTYALQDANGQSAEVSS